MATQSEIAGHYARMRLETASHERIIWQIHAKCGQLMAQAASADPAHQRMLLTRAQNLLAELEGSLKITDEISKSLFYLYDYCYCLLDSDDPKSHDLARKIISRLRDAFAVLLKKKI